jgi:hypothetical protein
VYIAPIVFGAGPADQLATVVAPVISAILTGIAIYYYYFINDGPDYAGDSSPTGSGSGDGPANVAQFVANSSLAGPPPSSIMLGGGFNQWGLNPDEMRAQLDFTMPLPPALTGDLGAIDQWGTNPDLMRTRLRTAIPLAATELGTTNSKSSIQLGSWFQWNVVGGFVGGLGRGAKNIVKGVVDTVIQTGAMAVDSANAAAYVVSGKELYHDNLSDAGKALDAGQLSAGQFYADVGANAVTMGVYGEGKALYQLSKGEITVDQASEQIGATAFGQFLGAEGLSRTTIGNLPIRQVPAYAAQRVGGLLRGQAPSNGLNILNREFTPNGTRVLQNLTNQQNALLHSDISRAASVLSREEMLSAAGNPGIARMQYGNAVERLVAREISSDPALRSLYQHVGGPNNPDFIGQGIFRGMNFHITTPGQAGAHLARPGYGQGLNIIQYERPPGFP